MVDVLTIVIPIVVGIVILGVSVYLFAMYCHPDQKGIGTSVLPKILVILSQALAWGQLLLIPLDLSVSTEGGSFQTAYEAFYLTMFVFIAFLNPLAIFLYESDEGESLIKRILWSTLFALISAAVWCAFIFVSFPFVSIYTQQGVTHQLPASLYVFLCMSVVGWIFLALEAAIGLVTLPIDLIVAFVNRPKLLTPQTATEKKQYLQCESNQIISIGQKLKQTQIQSKNKKLGWFSKRKAQAKFNKEVEQFRQKVNQLQYEYNKFYEEIQSVPKHPILYYVMLIGGILAGIISLLWVIQILGTVIIVNSQPLFLFLDSPLSSLSAGNIGFVGVMVYGILTLYLQACVVKGNTVFGLRIPFIIKIHPMQLNKTYMNSLLFNSSIMMVASISTSILAVWAFPTYLKFTFLSRLINNTINLLPLFSAIYGNRIPMAVLEGMIGLALGVVIIRMICLKKKNKGEKVGGNNTNNKEMKEIKK